MKLRALLAAGLIPIAVGLSMLVATPAQAYRECERLAPHTFYCVDVHNSVVDRHAQVGVWVEPITVRNRQVPGGAVWTPLYYQDRSRLQIGEGGAAITWTAGGIEVSDTVIPVPGPPPWINLPLF